MQDAFLFDADGDEDIIEKDNGQLLNARGDVATPEQVHEMFMEADDEDGGGPRLSTFACGRQDGDGGGGPHEGARPGGGDHRGLQGVRRGRDRVTSDELRCILMDLGEEVTEEEMDQLILEANVC